MKDSPSAMRNGDDAGGDTGSRDIAGMTFEQALKELEQIVGKLERGDVELEPSIALYERGEGLRAHCEQLLRRIEAKVEKITLDAQGEPTGSKPLDVAQ
jgi:exodeoxyribonuclease VII small subunit